MKGKKTPESKKRCLKSVALVLDHLMTTGVTKYLVSNTGAVINDNCVM